MARVVRIREGHAGRTPKWECDLIDGNDSRSVLLCDAWGGHIAYAKARLQDGKVYKFTNYIIWNKGRAMAFGNDTIKLTVSAKTGIEHVQDDSPSISLRLPLGNIEGILDMKASRVVCLVLAVDTPSESKDVQVKKRK